MNILFFAGAISQRNAIIALANKEGIFVMAESQPTWNLTRVFILIIVVVFLLSSVALSLFVFFDKGNSTAANTATTSESTGLTGEFLEGFSPVAKVDELKIDDTTPGTGAVLTAGANVTVLYTGALALTGEIFEKTEDGQPATFGLDKVIPGWSEGLVGMQVGGTRRLLIPSDQAYGAAGQGSIPANADLVFDVTLLNINE